MSSSLAFGLLGVALWTVLPGFAIVRGLERLSPRPIESWEDRSFAALAAGLSLFLIGSQVLARTHMLSERWAWVGGIVLTGISVVALTLMRSREKLSHRPDLGFLGYVGLAALGSLPALVMIAERPGSLPDATPWYYWNLALQTGLEGGAPSEAVEWGTSVPFLADYPGFTAATSLVGNLVGRFDVLHAAQMMRALAAVGAVLAMYYLVRAWRGHPLAAVGAAWGFMAAELFATKLMSYRPEAFGYALMLLTPALVKRWVDTRNFAYLGAASLGLLAVAQVHGIAWTGAAILVIATLISELLTSRDRRSSLKRVLIAFLVVGATWALPTMLLGGALTDADKLETLPDLGTDGTDPTWQFASFDTAAEGQPPPDVADLVEEGLNRGFAGVSSLVYGAVILAVGALVVAAATERQRGLKLLVFIVLVLIGIGIVSMYFAVGWETYVPQRTGWRRVAQLSILLLPFGAGAATCCLKRAEIRSGAVGAVVVGFGLLLLIAAPSVRSSVVDRQPTEVTLQQQRWLSLEPGLALANAYTEGYLPAVFGLNGLLDGRAPYTEADLLDRANGLLEASRDFFAEPLGGHLDLEDLGVRYIIVGEGNWVLGTSRWFGVNLVDLEAIRGISLIEVGPGFRVYELDS